MKCLTIRSLIRHYHMEMRSGLYSDPYGKYLGRGGVLFFVLSAMTDHNVGRVFVALIRVLWCQRWSEDDLYGNHSRERGIA